jgi:dTDP-N-acetylfucosamine:lipid II N-acetylfucosaminyltransferase
MIAHIFQIERHKNIENYAFNFVQFLKNNLTKVEFENHIFYFTYHEKENLKDSFLNRLEEISLKNKKVIYFSDHISLMKNLNNSNYENNIFHQLSSTQVFIYLFKNYKLLKKTSWMMWGGDVYNVFIDKSSFKYQVYDFIVRRFVIKNLKFIIGFKGDYDLLQSRYNSRAKYCFALYDMPSKIYALDEYKDKSNDTIKILVAHSANSANNHEIIFQKLLPYKNENIEIICPLSYGDLKNGAIIEKRGYELFGEKFHPLKEFMKPDKFSRLLEDIDVAVFSIDRQAAVGILTTLISLGKKVYYKKDVVPFDFYKENEIKIFDTDELKNKDFSEFVDISIDDRIRNIKNINIVYYKENIIKLWRDIFDS